MTDAPYPPVLSPSPKYMKTTTAVRTTACAACCGLAGVGAFLSAPASVTSHHSTHHSNICWGNSALSSPLNLGSGGNNNNRASAAGGAPAPRASVCPQGSARGAGDSDGGGYTAAAGGGRIGTSVSGTGQSRRGKRHRAATLGNLDLKPAYRLFDTVPPPPTDEASAVARKSDDIDLNVDGKSPYGKPSWPSVCVLVEGTDSEAY